MAKVRIISDGSPGNTHIFVDSIEVKDVRSFTVEADADDSGPPEVYLTILATELEVELEEARVESTKNTD